MSNEFVTINLAQGNLPLVATAIHNGHRLRESLQKLTALSEAERLREEDPLTGLWTTIAAKKIIAHYSRFRGI